MAAQRVEREGEAVEPPTIPPASSIPHFFKSPPPQPFPPTLATLQSTIPTDPRIPRQPPLLDISLHVSVPPSLHRLLPRLYPSLPFTPTIDDLHAPQTITVANTPANRSLLHHALYGILPDPIPSDPILRDVLAANLRALRTILPRAPTFAISLEPSPYFGVAGLEARVVLAPATPTTSPPAYHLLGISAPETSIPRLECLLRELCPGFSHRLLGVVAHLTPAQHNSPLGVATSRTIAHFMRLAPPGPFITPDETLSPPPLTPAKLAALGNHDITNLVNTYRPRLEHAWPHDVFNSVVEETELLRRQDASLAGGEGMLEHAWAPVGDQYPNLRWFVAALGTAFAYKPPVRTKVPVTCLDGTDPTFAAEFVLQARQFVLLRKMLVT